MATTTNYGWTTPDNTALVKDGAAAIRTLGSSVDTTTKNLNPSTTLGDIEYRSSTANTNTRLPIGTTGQVLTVAGGVPSWGSAAGGMNLISRTVLSSTTNVSLNNVFSATYDNYRILFEGSFAGGQSDIEMRMRVSGSDNTTSNYNSFRATVDTAGNTGSSSQVSANKWYIVTGDTNPGFFSIDILRPFATVKTNWGGNIVSRGGTRGGFNTGFFDATTSFDGFSIFSSNACVGTLSVYGYGI